MSTDGHTAEPSESRPGDASNGAGVPAGILALLLIALLAAPGIGVRYHLRGSVDPLYAVFCLFFATNLLICYWEICLYRQDEIRARWEYWREWRRETGRTPAVAFLAGRVPLKRALAPSVWTDVWAAYSTMDPSYVDRETFGYTADIGNGWVTPAGTLFLYSAYTFGWVPPVAAGIVGAMLFWQWVYVSSLYLVSFFVAGRWSQVSRKEFWGWVFTPNSVWVLIPMLGLYVSVRLILDGSYAVLGW